MCNDLKVETIGFICPQKLFQVRKYPDITNTYLSNTWRASQSKSLLLAPHYVGKHCLLLVFCVEMNEIYVFDSQIERRHKLEIKPQVNIRRNNQTFVHVMANVYEESSKELLEAQSHIWNHTFNFVNSMSVQCAIQLGIFNAIHKHNKPINLTDLSAILSLPPPKTPHLHRLLRLLVHSKFLSDNEEELYSLTKYSRIFITGKTTDLSPFVNLLLDQNFLSPWHFLSKWFVEEDPSTTYELANGRTLWDAFSKMEEFNKKMNEGMSSDTRFTNEILVRDCREVFTGLNSLVDVGGGAGTLAQAIAGAFPGIVCSVLELPHVIDDLEDNETVKFVKGDMFDHIPNADAALFKSVLHDWSDQECVKILGTCKQAIPCKEDGGKVIIIEMVVKAEHEDYELTGTQYAFDMHMMVHTTGKQRTENEWKTVFAKAGFKGYKIIPLLGMRSVIEVYH